MGLKKVKGAEEVDMSQRVSQADPPSVRIYDPALLQMKSLAVSLLGITALTAAEHIAAVHEAAAAAPEADEVEWSQEDAMNIMKAVGFLPAPTHFKLKRLKGQGTLLMRAVTPDTPGARKMKYGGRTPRISILTAMKKEGILVPKDQAMDVPVKLVEDEGTLALALYLRRGKLRDRTEIKEEASTATTQAEESDTEE